MTFDFPVEDIAREIAAILERRPDAPTSAVDPLELLSMRDLADELKMSARSIERRIAADQMPDADGHTGVRRVWTRGLVNEIKTGMLRGTPAHDQ